MAAIHHGRFGLTRGIAALALAAAALLGRTASAHALGNMISGTTLHIQVQTGDETGEFTVDASQGQTGPGGVWSWSLPDAFNVLNESGDTIATIEHGTIFIDPDPVVTVNFGLTNPNAQATLFTITSQHLSFDTIPNAIGRASASLGITDLTGDGVVLTGAYAGGTKAYIANYNGLAPNGTNFATLLDNLSRLTAFGSNSTFDEFPDVGFVSIPDPVSSISAQFSFMLSGGDAATATSTFAVIPVPEPGSLALLALAGVMSLKRRRRA